FKKKVTFGKHVLFLRGGYLLKRNLEKLSLGSLRYDFTEGMIPPQSASNNPLALTQTLEIKDYQEIPIVHIVIAVSKKDLIERKKELMRKSGLLRGGALLLCLPIGYLLSLSVSRPVAHLRNAAQEMSAGKLDVRVEEEGSGEIAELMHAFNRMVEQLEENQKK